MPTIAAIADIHGNLPALEAVLAELDRLRPDEVLVGGDLVGRGPRGSAVVAAVAERGWATIRGNHEDYLLDFVHRRVPESWWHEDKWSAARWMADELDRAAIAFIEALPLTLRAASAPGLLLLHGSPRSHSEGLGPWTSDDKLSRHLASVEEPLLVCAHTHRPMHRRLPAGEVVNVGSVGLPFNGDPRAQYCLFHHDERGWRHEFRRVEYDRERTLESYRDSGFLAAGGVTAALLALELEHAAPFLVPFLKWAELSGVEPEAAQVGAFRDFYDPGEPLHDFFVRLDRLADQP